MKNKNGNKVTGIKLPVRLLVLTILIALGLQTWVFAATKVLTLQSGTENYACILSDKDISDVVTSHSVALSTFISHTALALSNQGLVLDSNRLYQDVITRIKGGNYASETIQLAAYCVTALEPIAAASAPSAPAVMPDASNAAVNPVPQVQEIPQPSVLDTLAAQGFTKISSFSTKYKNNTDRGSNVDLAASHINGTLLQPGQVFSTDAAIGRRTVDNGFKEATIYVSGKLGKGIGGGICQVSSTLYNAVLRAGIVPISRRNHSLRVEYVGIGLDATISSGSIDLKFSNPYPHPIYIEGITADGVLTMNIYGFPADLGGKAFDTYVDAKSSKKADTYLITYEGGKEISRTYLNTSTYH